MPNSPVQTRPDDDWDERMARMDATLARTKAMQDVMVWQDWRRKEGLRRLAVVGEDGRPPAPAPVPPERLAVVIEFPRGGAA